MEFEERFIAHGVLIRQKRLLVLLRAQNNYAGGVWDIPGGTVERGEDPVDAVEREFLEETGIRVKAVCELAHQFNLDTEGRSIRFATITYVVEPCSDPSHIVLNPAEHVAYSWEGLEGLIKLPLVWHLSLVARLLESQLQ